MKIIKFFSSNLLAHEFLHFFSGIILAVIFYSKYHQVNLAIICFLVSIFIDADHFSEGILVEKLNFWRIFTKWPAFYWKKIGRMTVLFHAWEILAIILLFGRITNLWPLALSFLVPTAFHYLIDTFLYVTFAEMSIFFYFFIYRLHHRFKFEILCKNYQENIE